jgi:hypothetical protein
MSFFGASIADEKLAAFFIDGGRVDGRAAHRSGGEPRVDETVEIGQLIDRVTANLFVGDRPGPKGVGLDRLAQPLAGVIPKAPLTDSWRGFPQGEISDSFGRGRFAPCHQR